MGELQASAEVDIFKRINRGVAVLVPELDVVPRALPGEVVQEVVVAVNARARVGKTRRAKTGEGRAGEGYLRQAEIARIHFVRYRTQARVQHDRSLRVAEHLTIFGEEIFSGAVEAESRLIDQAAGNEARQGSGGHVDI